MKISFLNFLAAAALIVGLAACKTSGDDPKAVAKKFFEALRTMNVDEAANYATKESKSMLDLMKMGISATPKIKDSLKTEMDKQVITYSEPIINGDEATLVVTVNNRDKTNFTLKKEEGKWKVAFDKNSLMKSTMEKMEESGASPEEVKAAQDAMKKMNGDTFNEELQENDTNPDSLKNK